MARNFTGASTSYLNAGQPAVVDPPLTLAAIVRPNSSSGYLFDCFFHSSTVVDWALTIQTGLYLHQDTGSVKNWGGYTGFTLDATHWYFMGASGGSTSSTSNLIHFWCYEITNNTFVFGDPSVGTCESTWASAGTPAANAATAFSVGSGGTRQFAGATTYFAGDVVVCGIWDKALSYPTGPQTTLGNAYIDWIRRFAHDLNAWKMSGPKGLYLLDQSASSQFLTDFTGNGLPQPSSAFSTAGITADGVPRFRRGRGPLYVPSFVAATGGQRRRGGIV